MTPVPQNCLKKTFYYYGLADKTMLLHPFQELHSDYDPTARPWYMEAVKGSDVVCVSDIYLDATLNKYILALSTPVKKDGKILGVLGVDVIVEENKKQLNLTKTIGG